MLTHGAAAYATRYAEKETGPCYQRCQVEKKENVILPFFSHSRMKHSALDSFPYVLCGGKTNKRMNESFCTCTCHSMILVYVPRGSEGGGISWRTLHSRHRDKNQSNGCCRFNCAKLRTPVMHPSVNLIRTLLSGGLRRGGQCRLPSHRIVEPLSRPAQRSGRNA